MRTLLVPGFSQTAASWDPVIGSLAPGQRRDVRALDVPDGLDFAATATTLGDAGGTGCYAGYSMGGRLCLQLALDHPGHVERLVLVSSTAGIQGRAARASRRDEDERLARDLERDGVDAFLDRWMAQPLFARLTPGTPGRDERIRDPAVLAHQLRALGQGTQPSLWSRLSELDMPVVVVAGARDAKYVGFARTMAGAIGRNAEAVFVPDAGHAVHLERPAEIAHVLAAEVSL